MNEQDYWPLDGYGAKSGLTAAQAGHYLDERNDFGRQVAKMLHPAFADRREEFFGSIAAHLGGYGTQGVLL